MKSKYTYINLDKNLQWYKKTYDNLIETRKSRGLNRESLGVFMRSIILFLDVSVDQTVQIILYY